MLVVDTPWLTPLLMHICEVVYIGGAQFPGEHNYAVLAQAAVASCAVVASSAVMAHVQLAQELNNAAVSAAEDAAHAVRSAGATCSCFAVLANCISPADRPATPSETIRVVCPPALWRPHA